jgi:endonuclease YncB( thermonuclease family)
LRLDGMDAPELCQPEGPAAREALAAWALRRHVEVTVWRYDDYGRGLARIRLDGQDLGARMVREGHAWSYRYRRDPGPYLAEENEARARQRGLFRQAAPEVPRAFRQRHGPCPMPPSRRGD